ncbi:alternative ribosome rescue aminoacyl-tRNA hydrolase ArfB [Ferrimonas lipolytica]|uniref:Aminoacyl-tRNA hydrolase n=1 Tax=Ferrimonas lipolytica TaxID=2724191 RepID=A0A6H1UJX1_9GAMM|nr:alternative ribosome rescue aminoacyl-tRNA hydrolase ArfB [Ferrimonas lipolytica]QIZ78613.1 aminoacyl-tRNA hydrolase [Ferrimonas lipolytica]
MLQLSARVTLPAHEIEMQMIRASGPGGQHVNKTSTAIQLIFDVNASKALPEAYKEKLLSKGHPNLSASGKLIIKAQQYRSQEMNRQDALERLKIILLEAMVEQRKRYATKPTRSSQRRRVDSKKKHGQTKALRTKKFD